MGELSPPGLETIRPGDAKGLLLGGTLTQLLASIGTPFAFAPPRGYVLFLDEVGERPYRLDRQGLQLRQTRAAPPPPAIVIGPLRNSGAPQSAPPRRRGHAHPAK